jgi:hypothetical protein
VSLRNLSRERLSQTELHQSWAEIDRPNNDRGAAIMASAFVEEALARLVGTQSGFATKIDDGYERGLYKGLVRNDLHVIRRVRNAFGHTTKAITFDTPAVVEEIGKFEYVRWLQSTGGLTFGARGLASPHRETYTNICPALINDLSMAWISGGVLLDFSVFAKATIPQDRFII